MLHTSIHRKNHYQGDKYSTKPIAFTGLNFIQQIALNTFKQVDPGWMCLKALLTFVSYRNLSFQYFKVGDFKALYLQALHALRTPGYYGHLANTDSCWIPGDNYRRLTPKSEKLPLLNTYEHLSRSRQHNFIVLTLVNWHQSAFFNILAESSQIIIFFFLFFSSSLSIYLPSEHFDSRLTSSFCETIVLTCDTTVMMYLMFIEWIF